MANIRLIKGRIKSAKNISQITKAMELVAASKMKKAQSIAAAGKFYAEKIHEMVTKLASGTSATDHPLLAQPKNLTGKRLLILVSSNKGLCGGLNTNLFRFLMRQVGQTKYEYVTVGKKGAAFAVHMPGSIAADFSSEVPFVSSVPAIIDYAVKRFLAGEIDGVDLAYNEFISVLVQEPRLKHILPLAITSSDAHTSLDGSMLIEPSPDEVLQALLPHYIENQLRDAILEAEASEQSARMLAMRNATDNAKSLMTDLTLVYNKARQEKITYEISDIVTAQLAGR